MLKPRKSAALWECWALHTGQGCWVFPCKTHTLGRPNPAPASGSPARYTLPTLGPTRRTERIHAAVVEDLLARGVAVESDGAKCVFVEVREASN